MAILPRQYGYGYSNTCQDGFGNYYNCNSGWNTWGRWVALAVIVVLAILIFFLFSCLSARRRRRAGMTPYRGTGWAGRTPIGHAPATYSNQQPYYNNQPQYQSAAPPQYTPQPGGYYGQNQGYFGGQQTGNTPIELQQPQNAYRGGDNVYDHPVGAPPKKTDGIIR